MKSVAIFLLLVLFCSATVGYSLAADYYVDNTCPYNGNGTSQTCASGAGQAGPFNSLSGAQDGVTGSRPDDRLLFKAGQTFTGLFTIKAYGASGHPFTVSSYGTGGKPIFNGDGLGYWPTWGVLNIINASNITIDGVAVTNGGNCGIWIYRYDARSSTNHIVVTNSRIYNNPNMGIAYYGEPDLGRTDGTGIEFSSNDISGNTAGIYLHRVNYGKVHHNAIYDGVRIGDHEPYGIAYEAGSYNEIHNNLIYNVFTNGIGIYGDFGVDGQSNYNKIYRNIIYGTKYSAWSRDITLQGQVGANNAIYNNILYSTDPQNQHFVDDTASSVGNVFYGNVLANGLHGILTFGATWDVKNNIFYNITAPVRGSNLTFSNNIAYPASAGVLNAIVKDPKFTNPSGDWIGFTLQGDSPAIDAGANLGSLYSLALDPNDLVWPPTTADQNSYGAGWEIGAFVYRSGSPAGQVPNTTQAGVQTYTINASSTDANGTISPSGLVSVPSGANQTFVFVPASGYKVANVQVDGSSVGATSSYTFSNVTENHTIQATFKQTSRIPPGLAKKR